ncbi:unnamed protein product [Jaminaea pallidilutea]
MFRILLAFSALALTMGTAKATVYCYKSPDCTGNGEEVSGEAPIHDCNSWRTEQDEVMVCKGFDASPPPGCTGCVLANTGSECRKTPLVCFKSILEE